MQEELKIGTQKSLTLYGIWILICGGWHCRSVIHKCKKVFVNKIVSGYLGFSKTIMLD